MTKKRHRKNIDIITDVDGTPMINLEGRSQPNEINISEILNDRWAVWIWNPFTLKWEFVGYETS